MPNDITPPIQVSNEISLTAISSLGRTILAMGLTYLVSSGRIEADQIEGITSIAVAVAAAAYGVFKQVTRKKQLLITAEAAPNSVAQVK